MRRSTFILIICSLYLFVFILGAIGGYFIHKKEINFWQIQKDREFIKAEIKRIKEEKRFIDHRLESLILTLRLMREKETNHNLKQWIDDLLNEIEENQERR